MPENVVVPDISEKEVRNTENETFGFRDAMTFVTWPCFGSVANEDTKKTICLAKLGVVSAIHRLGFNVVL